MRTIAERHYEEPASMRIANKYRPRPYELATTRLDNVPWDANEKDSRKNSGTYGFAMAGQAGVYAPVDGIPLPDFDFPIPAGRGIMHWLYKHQMEPCNMQRSEVTLGMTEPEIFQEAWYEPSAVLIGNVVLSNECGVFGQAVLRADRNKIWIGKRVHILEGTVITTAPAEADGDAFSGQVIIGESTTVGSNCHLHGCFIDTVCSIGSNTTIRYGACISPHSIITPGSVVEEDQYIPPNEVWGGNPARFIRAAGDVDKFETFAESEELYRLHMDYMDTQVTYGTVWAEYDEVVQKTEDELRSVLQDRDPSDLLPLSLLTDLLMAVPHDEQPNPAPTICEKTRELFGSSYDTNRHTEQAQTFTGGYGKPNYAAAI